MKQVLIVLPNDNLGGAEQYLKNLAVYFLEQNYHITVLFLKKKISDGWSELDERHNFRAIYTNSRSERKGLFEFLRHIYKYRTTCFEYIFTSHVHLTGIIGVLLRVNLLKKNYFVGRESTSIFKRFSGLKLLFFKAQYIIGYPALDLLICQTETMYDQLQEALPRLFTQIKVKTIANPIDLMKIRDLKIDENLPYSNFIVAAGRLIYEKGFDILIDAFNLLKEDFPSLNLVILGEGTLRDQLEKKIIDLKLDDNIFLPGFTKNVYPYFKRAEACVVSSRIEGFPNVLLQMMSQNHKVISTLCAGGIEDIRGVEIAKNNDVVSLYEAIKNCLYKDTTSNRELFNEELKQRSIDSFVRNLKSELESE